jgi:hypothetical protein
MSEGAQPFGFPHRSLRDFQEMAAADKHIPEEATAGDFIYVGQGKKELTKVALEALDTLQKSDALMQIERAGDFYTPDRISDALRSQLRLMIEVPLSQQKAQVDWLKKDAGISVPMGGIT